MTRTTATDSKIKTRLRVARTVGANTSNSSPLGQDHAAFHAQDSYQDLPAAVESIERNIQGDFMVSERLLEPNGSPGISLLEVFL